MSVPSGNFGNLTAGLIAKRLGVPVSRYVAATNVNDVVPEYLRSGPLRAARVGAHGGERDGRRARRTTSSACRRLYGGDLEALRRDIVGVAYDDARVVAEIGEVYRTHGYLLDPHGAIAWLGLQEVLARGPRREGRVPRDGAPGEVPRGRRAGDRRARRRCRRRSTTRSRARATAHRRSPADYSANCERLLACLLTRSAPSPAPCRAREAIPDRYKWDLAAICRDWDEWSRLLPAARVGRRRFKRFQGTLVARRRVSCSRRSARWTRWARSATASGTSPRCSTTRTSATTRSTRGASRSRSCSRGSSRRARGSTPSCSRSRSTPSAAGWRRTPILPSTGSRSRACSTSRSTCSTRRASG